MNGCVGPGAKYRTKEKGPFNGRFQSSAITNWSLSSGDALWNDY